ncbi:uncharacterized protein LOC124114032 isoform X1 [Haliotis rufescens]|uniref:uncharacterized protein LOC124114032 isoform X1 n=1 Tax=Haliotis rufescens TaxID=6454 RepID=UPI00201FB354|nr:uncharacterized protein LOC124114032 isoform X1 [Haliotis rufescens]
MMELGYSELGVCLYLLVCPSGCKEVCSPGEYFDSSTRSCQPCSEPCTGEVHCHLGCRSQACQSDNYYDVDVGGCRSCAELCHQAEARGTRNKCMDLCPVETPVRQTVTPSPRDLPSPTPPDNRRTGHQTNHAVVTVLVVAVLIMVLSAAAVATMAVLKLGKVRKYSYRCFFFPAPLQDPDSHHGEGSTAPTAEIGFTEQQHDPT